MSRFVLYLQKSGKSKHITQLDAARLIKSGDAEYLGRCDGKEVIAERSNVVYWNGSDRNPFAMHLPGEVVS